ncbi:hypothetical protein H2198_008927 [Neophaeococcomyces mojaviensis]|uniref:Uncharacterized protein n=1 Tax=Neophaeococcomyces mojaviensis TaxID=3383035 RepID=A0ACC2ZVW9_9EURO|nr:hypothetical protein H2198_008927 [Knufia sp. JES_112]
MPTKHKRKHANNDDKSHYDLPPTSRAKPLPVIAPTKDFLTPRPVKKQKLNNGKSKGQRKTDDTPKTFARLMAWHQEGKKLESGLDNGEGHLKKQKKKQKRQPPKQDIDQATAEPADNVVTSESQPQLPPPPSDPKTKPKMQILPGESLAEFGIRVDQSLPLSAIAKNNKSANAQLPADLRDKAAQKLTKHNKRLARMQADWRATEARLRGKEEEEMEDNEERLEEERLLWDSIKTVGKKGKRKLVVDDDPWRELEKKRAETRQKNIRDVVEAPPVLKEVKPLFKERKERVLPRVDLSDTLSRKTVRRKDEVDEIRKGAVHAARARGSGITA